jgi:tRNA A37 methylthiotransferase MiaB
MIVVGGCLGQPLLAFYQYPAVKLVTSPSPYSRIGDMVEIDYSYWEPYDVATQGGP